MGFNGTPLKKEKKIDTTKTTSALSDEDKVKVKRDALDLEQQLSYYPFLLLL